MRAVPGILAVPAVPWELISAPEGRAPLGDGHVSQKRCKRQQTT